MGYYTHYTLQSDDGMVESHEGGIAVASGYGNPFDDSCKWYEHEKHMRAYSKLHPRVLFTLDGDGEEAGDVWRKWFRDGAMCAWKLCADRPAAPTGDFT